MPLRTCAKRLPAVPLKSVSLVQMTTCTPTLMAWSTTSPIFCIESGTSRMTCRSSMSSIEVAASVLCQPAGLSSSNCPQLIIRTSLLGSCLAICNPQAHNKWLFPVPLSPLINSGFQRFAGSSRIASIALAACRFSGQTWNSLNVCSLLFGMTSGQSGRECSMYSVALER